MFNINSGSEESCASVNQWRKERMKQYELSILIHPDLEMSLDKAVGKVKDLINQNQGKILKEASEGKKHLAYTIKGQDYAVFYYFEVELPSEAPSKISSVLNISDEVIRYLLVGVDERKIKMDAKRREYKARKNAGREEEKTEEE